MAENVVNLNTRISLKYDLYSNWSTNNPVLLKGEAALAYIPENNTLELSDVTGVVGATPPKVLMKVGDGEHHYNDLHFIYGLAADVHGWAKAANKPEYEASEIKDLATFITGQDADTQYTLVKVNDYQYKLMSKAKDATEFTTEVATLDIPQYDDTKVKEDIQANADAIGVLNGDVETAGSVAKSISDAIAALNLAGTYETKEDASSKLAEAKTYAEQKATAAQTAATEAAAADATTKAGQALADAKSYADGKDAENLATAKSYAEEKATAAQTAATEAAAADATSKANKALDDAKTYADGKDAAIEAAQAAGDNAQDAVDALAEKVGTVTEGKTVVEMIADAQAAATYDDTKVKEDIQANADAIGVLNGDANTAGSVAKAVADAKTELQGNIDAKVASVTAGDNSVTVGGTATAPTVAAKISQDADNALSLADDGLKVVIPAAAEYSVVKDENAGDYAAVYHLTKDGVNVGAAINIPKDMVVKSGSVVGDKIVLVLNDEAETEIEIPVSDLIEYVTSGSQAGDMVVVTVSDDHKVTATITDGTVTLAKLATDVQTAIGKAHTHENESVLNGITADKVEAWDKAESNAKSYADGKDAEHLATAKSYAEEKATAAQNAAVEAAAADATSKAGQALADAKSYADGKDAENLATAKSYAEEKATAAQTAAAEDATAKANKALDDAKTHANGLNTAMDTRVSAVEAKPAMGLTAENIADYNEAVELADTAVQTVTAPAGSGLTATRNGNDVVLGFDSTVTFVFDCGDSSNI